MAKKWQCPRGLYVDALGIVWPSRAAKGWGKGGGKWQRESGGGKGGGGKGGGSKGGGSKGGSGKGGSTKGGGTKEGRGKEGGEEGGGNNDQRLDEETESDLAIANCLAKLAGVRAMRSEFSHQIDKACNHDKHLLAHHLKLQWDDAEALVQDLKGELKDKLGR